MSLLFIPNILLAIFVSLDTVCKEFDIGWSYWKQPKWLWIFC